MATRSTWNIYTLDSGEEWVLDSEVYIPNESLVIGKTSRMAAIDLADGSIGTVISSTKYTNKPLAFKWNYIASDDSLITVIEAYVEDAEYIKIVDHLGVEYIGTLVEISKTDLVGEVDYFDINTTLLRH